MGNAGKRGELLTSAEFAQAARVHPTTVERWRYEGHGPAPIKLGHRTVRYRSRDVARFLGDD